MIMTLVFNFMVTSLRNGREDEGTIRGGFSWSGVVMGVANAGEHLSENPQDHKFTKLRCFNYLPISG